MNALGYVTLNGYAKDEELLTELWKMLSETGETIKVENMMIAFAGILNLVVPDVLLQHNQQCENHQKRGYLCFDEH